MAVNQVADIICREFGKIVIVCSWCNTILQIKNAHGDPPMISHSLCEKCFEEQQKIMKGQNMDIKGLCKVRVFKALFNRAMPQGMGFLHYKPRNIDDDEAKKKIQFSDGKAIQYFDYVEGRVMKIDIRPDYIDTTLYNRDNGPNAAENAILEEFTKP